METDTEALTDSMESIHPTAIIDPGARIGEGVTIGPYSIIGENVEIGDGTIIGAHNVINGWTRIGKKCRIFHSSCIGIEPQDLKYGGDPSRVEIGDGNTIREFVTIHRGTDKGDFTRIGDHNLLMAYVHIAHNCVIGDHVILANAVTLAGYVAVEDHAIIGGVTPIHQFVRVGAHAFIGGGSRVPQDIPPFLLASGNPLKIVGINQVGLKRRGFSPETCQHLRRAYKIIYRSDKNVSQAIETIRKELPEIPELDRLVEFIESSERGIT